MLTMEITKKRIVPMGRQRGRDIWTRSSIQLLTPKIEERIRQVNLIRKCRNIFEKKDLTADQAERILAILTEEAESEG